MKLKKLMQCRLKDAARQGIRLSKRGWFPTYGCISNAEGHYEVMVSANSEDESKVIVFRAWVDFDDNVYSSTGIVIAEL